MSNVFVSKLVRNRIPAMMKGERTHDIISCDQLTGDQLLEKLCEKLQEEVSELIDILKDTSLSPKNYKEKVIEEVSDVVQVLMNIVVIKMIRWPLVVHMVAKKRNQKGDFSRGLFVTYRKREDKEATVSQ